MTETVTYLAYGSNMLTGRLVARCASAQPVGIASVPDYRLVASKTCSDGSGKAGIVPAAGHVAHGVLFDLSIADVAVLDRFENLGVEYHRDDAFGVVMPDGAARTVMTYLPDEKDLYGDIPPYDWYWGLVAAGAREHGIASDYVEMLEAVALIEDPVADRPSRREAARLLEDAGYWPKSAAKFSA